MATLPLKASRKRNSVLLFIFCGQKDFAHVIHSEIHPGYGDKCFTRPAIHVWCKKFACGRESVVDEKRPGRCVVSTTDPAIAAVASLIRSDRRVSISVQINLDDMLKYRMLLFDIRTGFIAESIHFSGSHNSQ